MSRRPPETLADYLVVAICPTLIGVLVGSLMYFLINVFYGGDQKGQILWVITCFVVATVGIARIAMERGYGYASLFGVPLAGALTLVLTPLAWPLLGIVWWATHKLTWDCTLIEDAKDVSGQGLLQQMGLGRNTDEANAPPGTTAPPPEPEATTSEQEPPLPWWQTLLDADHRPHAPGVWVIYFSLAALPLFGIGGWVASSLNPEVRQRAFWLLVIYVACGLGLLLATSFLGLRRYLRQRRLEMPLEMTATWLTTGVILIAVMLALAAILPRPSAEYSLSQLPYNLAWTIKKASRFALVPDGIKDDSGNRDTATGDGQDQQESNREGDGNGKSDSQEQQGGSKSSKKSGKSAQSGGKGKGSSSSGDSQEQGKDGEGSSDSQKSQESGKSGGKSKSSKGGKSKGNKGNNAQQSDQQGKNSQDQSRSAEASSSSRERQRPEPQQASSPPVTQQLSQMASGIGQLIAMIIRLVFLAAIVIALICGAWYYRDELLAAWKKLLDELRELWEAWFGGKSARPEPALAVAAASPPRPFSAYSNPFLSGAAASMSWPELVRYTFEAVEAWGRERQCPRLKEYTPLEFAQLVGSVEPKLAAPLQSLAATYSQLAYASKAGLRGSPETLRQLWYELGAN